MLWREELDNGRVVRDCYTVDSSREKLTGFFIFLDVERGELRDVFRWLLVAADAPYTQGSSVMIIGRWSGEGSGRGRSGEAVLILCLLSEIKYLFSFVCIRNLIIFLFLHIFIF